MFIYLHITYDCLHAIAAELSIYEGIKIFAA
jgi:hypothetical protein